MSKLAADLVAALENEDICDITLQGEDGEKVPASRFLLSARSKVFQKMLFGNFKESDATNIPLGYSSKTIKRIVHYCYTDEVMEPLEDCKEEKVRDMVRFRREANYFELEDLEDKVITIISKHIAKYPSLACAVLDETSTQGEADGVLSEIALGIIGLRAKDSLLPTVESHEGGVLALSASVLESVLTREEFAGDNFMKYRCLQARCGENVADGSQEISYKVQEERFTKNKEHTKSIDFRLIKASDLAGITGSRLVTKDQYYDAFKAHPLSAKSEHGASGAASRNDTKGAFVLVTGAGVPEINGAYSKDGERDGVMKYAKEGTREGKRGKFSLLRATGRDSKNPGGRKCWFINWRQDDGTQIHFYFSEMDGSEIDTIPHSTWVANDVGDKSYGVPPMPRVLFVPR